MKTWIKISFDGSGRHRLPHAGNFDFEWPKGTRYWRAVVDQEGSEQRQATMPLPVQAASQEDLSDIQSRTWIDIDGDPVVVEFTIPRARIHSKLLEVAS